MNSKKWTLRFLELASHISSWSKDPSTKVGAVIADQNRRIVGLGFNGFPRWVHDDDERYNDRPTKYKLVVHAEANAILNSNKSVEGCHLYTTKFPCSDCTKLIIQSGISVVCTYEAIDPRWSEDSQFSQQMLLEASVTLILA